MWNMTNVYQDLFHCHWAQTQYISDVSNVRLLLKGDMQHSFLLLVITMIISLYTQVDWKTSLFLLTTAIESVFGLPTLPINQVLWVTESRGSGTLTVWRHWRYVLFWPSLSHSITNGQRVLAVPRQEFYAVVHPDSLARADPEVIYNLCSILRTVSWNHVINIIVT